MWSFLGEVNDVQISNNIRKTRTHIFSLETEQIIKVATRFAEGDWCLNTFMYKTVTFKFDLKTFSHLGNISSITYAYGTCILK